MHRLYTPFLRRFYLFAAAFLVVFFSVQGVRHSTWYKERIYQLLLNGNAKQRIAAAATLVELDAQAQLLRALRANSPTVSELAEQSLWQLWFHGAGEKVYRMLATAQELTDNGQYGNALFVLNFLTANYPQCAEAWNRRGTVYWYSGDYRRSLADFRRVLKLNPYHFGAWQGLALCQWNLGDLPGACQCLRVALRIYPSDPISRRLLRWAEELLRRRPSRDRRFEELV